MDERFEHREEATGLPNDGRWNGRGRAPFQVLVLPYRRKGPDVQYAVFKRADAGYWQFIAGGGEGRELPLEAARREAWEEAAVPATSRLFPLDSRNTVPVLELAGSLRWGPDVLVVPEYTFGVQITGAELRIGDELNHRIIHRMIPGSRQIC